MQTSHDDVVLEKEDALARLWEMRQEMHNKRNDKVDAMMRAEIDRLRADL